ncbi:MAG: ankyrin repeat domain-containing protein, partial [Spirochaetia bacterium]
MNEHLKHVLCVLVPIFVATPAFANGEWPALDEATWDSLNREQLAELLTEDTDVNAKDNFAGMTPLMYAARWNENPDVFTALMEAGAQVDTRARDATTALMQAARSNGNPEVIEILLDAGADVNASNHKGGTSLTYA